MNRKTGCPKGYREARAKRINPSEEDYECPPFYGDMIRHNGLYCCERLIPSGHTKSDNKWANRRLLARLRKEYPLVPKVPERSVQQWQPGQQWQQPGQQEQIRPALQQGSQRRQIRSPAKKKARTPAGGSHVVDDDLLALLSGKF